MPSTSVFDGVRSAPLRLVIVSVVVVNIAFAFANVAVNVPAFHRTLLSLSEFTGNLIHPEVPMWLGLLVIVGLLIVGLNGLWPADIGWRLSAIWQSLPIVFGFWMAMQIAFVIAHGAVDQPTELADVPHRRGWTQVFGGIISLVVSAPLVEETFFRGYLTIQLYLILARRLRRIDAIGLALLIGSVLFGTMHVAEWLYRQDSAKMPLLLEQSVLIFNGLLFAIVYVASRNLFIAVGLHILWNQPMAMVQVTPGTIRVVWYVLTITLTLGWFAGRHAMTRK